MKKITAILAATRCKIPDKLARRSVWHLVWMSVLGAVLIAAFMDWLLNGRVGYDFILTAVVAAAVMASMSSLMVDVVTKRLRKAESDLVKANEKYSLIFHEVPVGICQATPQGRYVAANMELARILGYDSPRELMSRVTDIGGQVYADPGDWLRLLSLLESRARAEQFESLCKRQDGSLVWTSLICRAIRDASGSCLYTESSITDISARKNLETWRADMDRPMRHDLKCPLGGIVSMATSMATNTAAPAQVREAVALIAATAEQVLRMVNISLEINKIESGAFELQVEEIDLIKTVFELVKLYGTIVDFKKIKIEVWAENNPAGESTSFVAPCHGLLSYCLVQNLLQNALESSPDAGVIRISLQRDSGVTLRVHNQGSVPVSIRERFFEKYTTEGKKSGTGLGTYSVKMIARAHGGSALMDTSDATGTLVTVRIPDLTPRLARLA